MKNEIEGEIIAKYDLGINFSGYPLEDTHSEIYEEILKAIPTAKREKKNRKYEVILVDVIDCTTDEIPKSLNIPIFSIWRCDLFGSDGKNGISYRPFLGKEPNWFQRQMSGWFFDCNWVKD